MTKPKGSISIYETYSPHIETKLGKPNLTPATTSLSHAECQVAARVKPWIIYLQVRCLVFASMTKIALPPFLFLVAPLLGFCLTNFGYICPVGVSLYYLVSIYTPFRFAFCSLLLLGEAIQCLSMIDFTLACTIV